jgi:hypothetical protein
MQKAINIRLSEMLEVYKVLDKHHINEYSCFRIAEFKQLANDFIRNGTEIQGVMYIEELNRDLEYNLVNLVDVPSVVVLRAKK